MSNFFQLEEKNPDVRIVWNSTSCESEYEQHYHLCQSTMSKKFVIFTVGANVTILSLSKNTLFLQIFEMVRGRRGAWGDTSYHPEGD